MDPEVSRLRWRAERRPRVWVGKGHWLAHARAATIQLRLREASTSVVVDRLRWAQGLGTDGAKGRGKIRRKGLVEGGTCLETCHLVAGGTKAGWVRDESNRVC